MKTKIVLSLVTTLLIGTLANANALKDSVAEKEAAVLKNPTSVKDSKKAKEVVKTSEKNMYTKGIYDATLFKQDSLKDRASMLKASVSKEAKFEEFLKSRLDTTKG